MPGVFGELDSRFFVAVPELRHGSSLNGFSPRELNDIRRLGVRHEPAIIEAWCEHCGWHCVADRLRPRHDETITAHLVDGRVISVPLAWSSRLSDATPAQRANRELTGDGHGVHWPYVDEDISAEHAQRDSGVSAIEPYWHPPANTRLQPTGGRRDYEAPRLKPPVGPSVNR